MKALQLEQLRPTKNYRNRSVRLLAYVAEQTGDAVETVASTSVHRFHPRQRLPRGVRRDRDRRRWA